MNARTGWHRSPLSCWLVQPLRTWMMGLALLGGGFGCGCTNDLNVGLASADTTSAGTGGKSDAPPNVVEATGDCEEGSTSEVTRLPVDIILIVDNSSSMAPNIVEVQERLNSDFAGILALSNLDFRVILISRYGQSDVAVGRSESPICIRAPLGADDCADPNNVRLQNNPPRFFHYSADVDSRNALCLLLTAFAAPDEIPSGERAWSPLAPNGYREYLRPEAFKSFIVITDDRIECSAGDLVLNDVDPAQTAELFDEALQQLSQAQFGTREKRKYAFYSIVGLAPHNPPTTPWLPSDPLVEDVCQSAIRPGLGYQTLSRMTGALRYPSCLTETFDAIFVRVAEGVAVSSNCSAAAR